MHIVYLVHYVCVMHCLPAMYLSMRLYSALIKDATILQLLLNLDKTLPRDYALRY